MKVAASDFPLQDTRVWSGELEPGRSLTLSISNQYGEETVVHTLQTESRAALQSWREALRQLFFDMSRCGGTWVKVGACVRHWRGLLPLPSVLPTGQWKQCCEEIMKIEIPAPRKPPQALAKQGSLYHEMGEQRWGPPGGKGSFPGPPDSEAERGHTPGEGRPRGP